VVSYLILYFLLIVTKLLDISDDGFVSLLAQDGASKNDLKVPEGELGQQMKADFDDGKDLSVTVLKALGQEQIILIGETRAQKTN
jgi:hypothetical protein